MTYASGNNFSKKVAGPSEPSGKGSSAGGTFASKIAGGAGDKGEPTGGQGPLKGGGITSKGNARKG